MFQETVHCLDSATAAGYKDLRVVFAVRFESFSGSTIQALMRLYSRACDECLICDIK